MAAASSPSVLVRRDGPVTVITLNRPARRNAVDGPTALALHAAFLAFERDDTQLVAVLTGGERVFCAGADLSAMSAKGSRNPLNAPWTKSDASDPLENVGPMGPSRMRLSKPVIAAVEGFAVAGGLELALWCDLRVCSKSAVFGVFCRRWGVPLIDGGTVRLGRAIGHSRAMDMILTGRPVAADEALNWGLVNRVVDDGHALKAALELAKQLTLLPQACMKSDRESAIDQWSLPEYDAIAREFELGIELVKDSSAMKGAQRFAQDKQGRGGKMLHAVDSTENQTKKKSAL